MSTDRPLVAIADGVLSQNPTSGEVHLRVADRSVRVRSNSTALLEGLTAYFADFRCDAAPAEIDIAALEAPPADFGLTYAAYPPGPGKTKIKDEYVNFANGRIVRKRLTAMTFIFGDVPSIVIGPCAANANQVVNFVNNRLIQWHLDRGYLLCHAAGVARQRSGVLLAGLSGRGKSTLALHLLARGLDFVSNDRLLIRRTGNGLEMVGVAKLPRVNPGTVLHNPSLTEMFSPEERRRFELLSPEVLWELEHKYDVDIGHCFGAGRFQPRAMMCAGAILTWQRSQAQPPELRPVELAARPDLLAALMKSPGVHYFAHRDERQPDLSDAHYLRQLAGTPICEVAGGVDFAAAADGCVELLPTQDGGSGPNIR